MLYKYLRFAFPIPVPALTIIQSPHPCPTSQAPKAALPEMNAATNRLAPIMAGVIGLSGIALFLTSTSSAKSQNKMTEVTGNSDNSTVSHGGGASAGRAGAAAVANPKSVGPQEMRERKEASNGNKIAR